MYQLKPFEKGYLTQILEWVINNNVQTSELRVYFGNVNGKKAPKWSCTLAGLPKDHWSKVRFEAESPEDLWIQMQEMMAETVDIPSVVKDVEISEEDSDGEEYL